MMQQKLKNKLRSWKYPNQFLRSNAIKVLSLDRALVQDLEIPNIRFYLCINRCANRFIV